MPYSFDVNEKLERGVRRIAAEQLDELLVELADESTLVHQRVHSARKRGKKLRGLLRLVRSRLADVYRAENEAVRDAGRLLSAMRDSQTMIDAFDKLAAQSGGAFDDATATIIRDGLVRRQHSIFANPTEVGERLNEFRERIAAVRERVDQWPLKGAGRAAIIDGVERVYARGRRAMATAYEVCEVEALHQWRKRVKDHWTHMLLLDNVWQPVMTLYSDHLKKLSDLLGDDHDLAVIAAELQAAPSDFGGAETVEAVTSVATHQRQQLQLDARKLGGRIYANKPKQMAKSLGALWRVWKKSQ